MEPENGLLNIERLYRGCLTPLSRGQAGSVDKLEADTELEDEAVVRAPKVIFDVLSLRQVRLLKLLDELEKRRVPSWVKTEIS